MTSLTDVYEGRVGTVASPRQQLVGTGLFLAGAATLVGAIAVATTGLGDRTLGTYAARELGGVLAGLGLPAVLLGVSAVLPATRRVRAAAIVGASLSVLGVALFSHAYPADWVSSSPLLALGASGVYLAGVLTTFWSLFLALATFKTRNDPGGTAKMEITKSGTIRLVEAARRRTTFGGVGLFGTDPDGDVQTQTNRDVDRTSDDGASVLDRAVSDGGSAPARTDGADADPLDPAGPSASAGDSTAASGTPTTGDGVGESDSGHAGGFESDARTGRSDAAGFGAGDRSTDRSDDAAGFGAGDASTDADGWSVSSEAGGRSTGFGGSGSSTATASSTPTDHVPGGNSSFGSNGGDHLDVGPEATASGSPSPAGDDLAEAVSGDEDDYCGDCRHFEYVKVEGDAKPYCAYYEDVLDDMDACEHWTEQSF